MMNLPIRRFLIPEKEYKKLNKDVWSEEYVKGFLVKNGYRVPINVRYRGGHTRDYPKKSFEISWQNNSLHYNAEYDDPSMVRNSVSFRFFQSIGVPSPSAQHCLLELNGTKLGVYLEIEAVNKIFFQRRQIDVKSLIYAVNDDANFSLINPDTKRPKRSLFEGYELMIGKTSDQKRLESFVHSINTLKYAKLTDYLTANLDIDNYLRWLSGAVLTGNYDGFCQNYSIYNCKSDEKFKMIPWDYEGTWGRDPYGELCSSDSVSIMGYNQLTKKLLVRKQFRTKYKDILLDILDNYFTEQYLLNEFEQLFKLLSQNIDEDRTRRWPKSVIKKDLKVIRTYIRERRKFISKAISAL